MRPKTAAGTPDFSLLVDGLAAEREQGITIDIAWRYLDAGQRRLVIIDSPGHEQYTRNMATGASHADVAILLVDARSGVKEQTRRHAADPRSDGGSAGRSGRQQDGPGRLVRGALCGDSTRIRALAARFGFEDALAIPVSAVLGDNVASRSPAMRWYEGPALLDAPLDRIPVAPSRIRRPTSAFPFNLWSAPARTSAGLAGTVSSGSVGLGDEVVEPISGRRARVRRIVTMGRDLARAGEGQASSCSSTPTSTSRAVPMLAATRPRAGCRAQHRGAPRMAVR